MIEQLNTPFMVDSDEFPYQIISDPAVLSKEPMVSVKMTTYNHEPYIERAIDGIIMQETDFPIELIIGEDCSTDKTRDIVLAYQMQRPDIIKVIAWDKNTGGKRNGRKVNEHLRGKYIAICEGDDYWHNPMKLQKQVAYLEENLDVGLVHGDFDYYFDKNKRTINSYNKFRSQTFSKSNLGHFELLTGKRSIVTCTVCLRKSVWYKSYADHRAIMGSNKYLMGDFQLWILASTYSAISYIPESLATYNVHYGSRANQKDPIKKLEFLFSGVDVCYALFDKLDIPEDIREACLRQVYGHTLHYSILHGIYDVAKQILNERKSSGIYSIFEQLKLGGLYLRTKRILFTIINKCKNYYLFFASHKSSVYQ